MVSMFLGMNICLQALWMCRKLWAPQDLDDWEDDFPSGNGNDRVPSDFGFGCETQCSD